MTKILAYVVLVLSAVGILLCVICFLLGVTGVYRLPENEPFLFFGIFVVWVPTILLMNRVFRTGPGGFPLVFTIFPVMFYGVSFCAMYSYLHVEKFDASRRCLNGHAISPLAKFCEECGAPAAPESTNSARGQRL